MIIIRITIRNASDEEAISIKREIEKLLKEAEITGDVELTISPEIEFFAPP